MRTHGAEALAFDVAVPGRAARGAAARLARRRDRSTAGRGAAVRLRGTGLRLPLGHDPDAVRGRADGARPRASTSSWRAAQEAAIEALARGRGRRASSPSTGPSTPPPATSSPRPATATTSATAWATASASPPTSCPRWAVCAPETPLPVADGLLASSRASTSTARRASASRTSWSFDPAQRRLRAADALPARGHRRRRLAAAPVHSAATSRSAAAGSESPAPTSSDQLPRSASSRHLEGAITPMISTGDLKKGIAIELDGELWQILDYHHIKMGRGSAQVKIKLRNIKRGQTVERSFQAGDKWPRAIPREAAGPVPVPRRRRLPLHGARDSYEQFSLTATQLGDVAGYLSDGMMLDRTSLRGRDDRRRAAGHRGPGGRRDRARLRR